MGQGARGRPGSVSHRCWCIELGNVQGAWTNKWTPNTPQAQGVCTRMETSDHRPAVWARLESGPQYGGYGTLFFPASAFVPIPSLSQVLPEFPLRNNIAYEATHAQQPRQLLISRKNVTHSLFNIGKILSLYQATNSGCGHMCPDRPVSLPITRQLLESL